MSADWNSPENQTARSAPLSLPQMQAPKQVSPFLPVPGQLQFIQRVTTPTVFKIYLTPLSRYPAGPGGLNITTTSALNLGIVYIPPLRYTQANNVKFPVLGLFCHVSWRFDSFQRALQANTRMIWNRQRLLQTNSYILNLITFLSHLMLLAYQIWSLNRTPFIFRMGWDRLFCHLSRIRPISLLLDDRIWVCCEIWIGRGNRVC
jgi:hypothetical protein